MTKRRIDSNEERWTMNKNSVICNFIAAHPDDWESLLTDEYEIKVKKEGRLAIFNYGLTCNYYEPVVQEARGIIIDIEALEVVCWPFRKFGNHTEGYADTIDWDTARVLEKVDGSIVKLWFDKGMGRWQFSTNGVIRAEKAPIDGMVGLSYGDIIMQADNVKDIPFADLNKDYTYIFELVSPMTRIVVKYERASLYHLGTRNNLTGEEYELDIGIKKPKTYPLCGLENCINAALALNKQCEGEEVKNEGFVVVDKDWHRVKIKSPDYIMMHHVSTMKTITKKECVLILLHERERLERIFETCPVLAPTVKYYDYKIAELLCDADKIGMLARSLYEEYSHDRKAVAGVLGKHRLSAVGFRCIDTGLSGREVMLAMPVEKFCKWIPDYVHEDDISVLFSHSEKD